MARFAQLAQLSAAQQPSFVPQPFWRYARHSGGRYYFIAPGETVFSSSEGPVLTKGQADLRAQTLNSVRRFTVTGPLEVVPEGAAVEVTGGGRRRHKKPTRHSPGMPPGFQRHLSELLYPKPTRRSLAGAGWFSSAKWEVVPLDSFSGEFKLKKGNSYKDLTPWSDFSGFRYGWPTREAAQREADRLNSSWL